MAIGCSSLCNRIWPILEEVMFLIPDFDSSDEEFSVHLYLLKLEYIDKTKYWRANEEGEREATGRTGEPVATSYLLIMSSKSNLFEFCLDWYSKFPHADDDGNVINDWAEFLLLAHPPEKRWQMLSQVLLSVRTNQTKTNKTAISFFSFFLF